jgi:uncharacterized protein (TIGR04206 family)
VFVWTAADLDFVFVFGLVNTNPPHLETVTAYLFEDTRGLPRSLLAWPVSAALWACAAASAALGAVDHEDPRVTAGLLALAGVAHLRFSLRFAGRPGLVALPVGVATCWTAAWWLWTAGPGKPAARR